MSQTTLSQLSPIFFLQTFILELIHASEQQGQKHCEELIEHIAKTAGCFFEAAYRNETQKPGLLDKSSYIELILGLKNNIGGNFSLIQSDEQTITVHNTCCPFGEGVTNFPELCRMTSSVFGGIAARNFGYAKVEIKHSIAKQHGHCTVCIHTNRHHAKDLAGTEYTDTTSVKEIGDINALRSHIEARMQQIWYQQHKPATQKHPPAIIAKSAKMQKILQCIEIVAPTSATVLIQGQTGVGKELIAKAIHAMSERNQKPFMAINCGAIPESLLESALFGHEKGAFTGAVEIHQGYFERANHGTLFLDEVDSLSPAAQTRLLRVIQESELERVGGKQTFSVDVRIISATNRNLEELVKQQLFRHDLFYRINVVRLMIPPLTEREEDLPYLVHFILQRLNKKYNRQIDSVSRDVMKQIRHYTWPGNIRELENVLERSFLFTPGREITQLDLELNQETANSHNPHWRELKAHTLDEVERAHLDALLTQHKGHIKIIAENMGLTTRAIYAKLKKHQLSPSDYRK